MAGSGTWGDLIAWPLVGIHAVLTQSGKLLTFGSNPDGTQGGTMIHDLWDPVTGAHHLIDHHMDTPTDIFCAAAIVLPGTDHVLIAGGDARPLGHTNEGVDDVNLYDDATGMIMPADDGTMNAARWYPTLVSLASGQVVVMGGVDINGVGQGTPEIYTPGAGWRALTGAFDADIVASNFYPKMWVGPSGEIFYIANGDGPDNRLQLMALDPSGDGSIREVARLPFYLDWMSPAIMYQTGHVLMNDWQTGLWTIDLTTATPTITHVADLSQDRDYANMTVLPDGTVLINGGTAVDNLEAYADRTALIWNPATGALTDAGEEAHPRIYHSTTILLPDATVLSLGGGSSGRSEHDYFDGQIYRPGYLSNTDDADAARPVVSGAPASLVPGETFRITVDDADAITTLTFVKTGAVTHNLNMDARAATLAFSHIDAHTLEVSVPADATAITAGSWMLFAWNAAGIPSVAPIIAVEPTASLYDGIGDLTEQAFAAGAGVTALDQVDWTGTPLGERLAARVDETTGAVATRFTGAFRVEAAGSYTFFMTADAQARLYVDGVAVAVDPAMSGPTGFQVALALSQGIHAFELRTLATGSESGTIDLEWSGAAFGRRQLTFDGVCDNLLVNGSLERVAEAGALPGWTAQTSPEIHTGGDLGLAARSGSDFAEIDAATGALSQTVATVAGDPYHLGLDIAGNPHGIASSQLEVAVNGIVIATITPGDALWRRYDLTFTGTGADTIVLRSPSGDTDAIGALVDTAVLTGTRPDDMDPHGSHIMGTDAGEMLMGGDGDDTIMGMGGDDHLMGMGGADLLIGGSGRDLLMGEDGDDTLVGGPGSDTLDGGAGNDTADYSALTDDVTLDLKIAKGQPIGVLGSDTLIAVENLIGGTGADVFWGSDGANRLSGGGGDDALHGRGGDDALVGGRGDDLLDGGRGTDVADYSAETRAIRLDLASADAQNTRGSGHDTLVDVENLVGGGGNDRLLGSGGTNRIEGGRGDDMLNGRGGADVLLGGDGDDRLNGGAGHDVLIGGTGHDLFVFASGTSAPGATRDVVTDFVQGEDRLSVGGAVFLGTHAFTGRAGEVRYDASGTATIVQVDANGDKAPDLEFALGGTVTLTSGDFLGLSAAAFAPARVHLALDVATPHADIYTHVCLA